MAAGIRRVGARASFVFRDGTSGVIGANRSRVAWAAAAFMHSAAHVILGE